MFKFVGEAAYNQMKAYATEDKGTAEIIGFMKELEIDDKKADEALAKGNYEHYLEHVRHRLNLLQKLDHYLLVRLVRTEQEYRGMSSALMRADKQHDEKAKQLDEHEKKMSHMAQNAEQREHIRTRFDDLRKRLSHYRLRVQHLRTALRALRTHMRERCKHTARQLRKVYRFA
jgi:hypothetical protein